LKSRKWALVDSDRIVYDLYASGDLPRTIEKEFGPSVRAKDGSVDRKALGAIVFENPKKLERLNQIVHPPVRERWKKMTDEAASRAGHVAVVIPLAYETDAQNEFASTWVVACSTANQRARLKERGFSETEIDRRLAAQWPL